MTDWDVVLFYGLNALSGLLLILLGAWASLRSGSRPRYALALFLLAWGAQLALTNAAAGTTNTQASNTMFRLAQFFLPLQAMLILLYVAQSNKDANNTGPVFQISRAAAWTVAGLATVGLVLFAVAPSSVLTVAEADDGTHIITAKPFSAAFFDAPRVLGVSLALLLLAVHVSVPSDSRKNWHLLVGLTLAWLFATAYSTSSRYDQDLMTYPTAAMFLGALLIQVAAVVLLAMAWRRDALRNGTNVALLLLFPACIVLGWISAPLSGAWSVILSPGVVRILVLPLLMVALGATMVQLQAAPRSRRIGITLAVASILVATGVLIAAMLIEDLAAWWTSSAGRIGVVGLLVLAWIGLVQMRTLLAPRTPA